MKFLFKSLLTFILIYFIMYSAVFFLDRGHEINYNIGNFNVDEKFTAKDNTYYFKISSEKFKINFQLTKNYKKAEKIIKKIYYKEINKYQCFMPQFKNKKIETDVMCLKEGILYEANSLNIEDINKYFKKYGYNKNIYIDKADAITVSNTQKIYKNNMKENNYIAIENYKGLTLFNSNEKIERGRISKIYFLYRFNFFSF